MSSPTTNLFKFELAGESLRKRRKIEHVHCNHLNRDQMRAFEVVKSHLESSDQKQLLFFIHGTAGTGKTTLLHSIRELLATKLTLNAILVCAPTGVASCNIDGETIHSAFNLSLFEKTEKTKVIPSVLTKSINFAAELKATESMEADDALKARLERIRFIILDEISMVGTRLFSRLEEKLRAMCGSDDPFAGRSVIICGDQGQLVPVQDRALYLKPTKRDQYSEKGAALYNMFQSVLVLKNVERQSGEGQEEFRTVLANFRRGGVSSYDINQINSRFIGNLTEEECQLFRNALRLYPFRDKVSSFNAEMLKQFAQPIHHIVYKEDHKGNELLSFDFSIGSPVMLTRNLSVREGLVNGSIGIVTDVIYPKQQTSPHVPRYIMVKFDNYRGKLPEGRDDLPIIPVGMRFQKPIGFVKRYIPLVLNYASTIHKVQGLTLDKVAIDFMDASFVTFPMMYVALTRVRKVTDLILLTKIEPEFISRLKRQNQCSDLKKEDARLADLDLPC